MLDNLVGDRALVCPFCGTRAERFNPFGYYSKVFDELKIIGGGPRQNAVCPTCGSFDRERLVFLYLQNYTTMFSHPAKVLHVAPEACLMKAFRAQTHLDYLTVDLCQAPGIMQRVDITAMPFSNETFDFVICNHVLEHIHNDRAALNEIYRVLKIPGISILQVPICLDMEKTYEDRSKTTPAERNQAFGQPDHVRIYGQDYVSRLREAGFRVQVYDPLADTAYPELMKYGLIKGERVFAGKKSGRGSDIDSPSSRVTESSMESKLDHRRDSAADPILAKDILFPHDA